MSEPIEKRVKSDLVVAFGFSHENANKTWAMYEDMQLSWRETEAMSYLEQKDPFRLGQTHLTLRKDMIETLEHLNYKLSTEDDE